MEYITTKEAAHKWHITERRIRYLSKSGRIKGAVLIGHCWHIPSDANKPTYEEYIKMKQTSSYQKANLSDGNFGKYGGSHMPDSFKVFFDAIIPAFNELIESKEYQKTLDTLFYKETPIYKADKFIKKYGNVDLYIKREDLNSVNSIYLYQAVLMALLTKKMNKIQFLTEAKDASYAFAVMTVCRKLNVECEIYIPYSDYLRQRSLFDEVIKSGVRYLYILEGNATIEDATNSAFRKFLLEDATSLFCLHDAIGPHPIPSMVEYAQGIVGRTAYKQLKDLGVKQINSIIGPSFIASNTLGIFSGFPANCSHRIIVESSDIESLFKKENIGYPYGFYSKYIDKIKAELPESYPCISPKLTYLQEAKKVQLERVSDIDAMKACVEFYNDEGIFPSLEDGYTLAYAIKRAKKMKCGNIVIAFTSNGEKDKDYILKRLNEINK